MRVDFFDCNAFIGLPARGCCKPAGSADELLAALEPAGVGRALAWHVAQFDCSPQEGNRLISEAIRNEDRLFGCWSLLPPQTGEIITPDFFALMRQDRVFALRAFPEKHRFLLDRVVFGRFFDEMAERRVPLLLSIEQNTPWATVYQLLRENPELTVVLCDIGVWGVDRFTWPLLESYPNVHIETSHLSIEAGGIEATVARFGAGRLLFGTGYPLRYAEAPALQLLHADISDGDRTRIASGNLDRLVSEVAL